MVELSFQLKLLGACQFRMMLLESPCDCVRVEEEKPTMLGSALSYALLPFFPLPRFRRTQEDTGMGKARVVSCF